MGGRENTGETARRQTGDVAPSFLWTIIKKRQPRAQPPKRAVAPWRFSAQARRGTHDVNSDGGGNLAAGLLPGKAAGLDRGFRPPAGALDLHRREIHRDLVARLAPLSGGSGDLERPGVAPRAPRKT